MSATENIGARGSAKVPGRGERLRSVDGMTGRRRKSWDFPLSKGNAIHQTANGLHGHAEDWLAAAKSITGSWHVAWLAVRSGHTLSARTSLGSAAYAVLGSPPGTYVQQ